MQVQVTINHTDTRKPVNHRVDDNDTAIQQVLGRIWYARRKEIENAA